MHSTGPGRYNSYRCDGGFRYNFEWVRQITFVIWSSIPSGLHVYVYCGECDLVVSFGWGIKTTCEGRICTIKTSVGDIKTKLFPRFFQSRCKLLFFVEEGGIRIDVALILSIIFFSSSLQGEVRFRLWTVLITLLQDDEPLVRDKMSYGFSTLLQVIETSTVGKWRNWTFCSSERRMTKSYLAVDMYQVDFIFRCLCFFLFWFFCLLQGRETPRRKHPCWKTRKQQQS